MMYVYINYVKSLLICCRFLFVENYERLEADKKKQVHKKRRFEGPTIRYHSVLMPLVSHSLLKEENVDVEGYACQQVGLR